MAAGNGSGARSEDGGVGNSRSQGATDGGSAAQLDAAPPTPLDAAPSTPIVVDDSNTLRVDVSVNAAVSFANGEVSKDAVGIQLFVSVVDVASGATVSDAEVKGGLVGHPTALPWVRPSLFSAGNGAYGGSVTGYDRAWEFSVVRGVDHLKGVVLVGPPFPAITFSPGSNSATVGWSPAHEANVMTYVCATEQTVPAVVGAPMWCNGNYDEGSLILKPSDEERGTAVPFPAPGASYWIELRQYNGTKVPIGSQGGAGDISLDVSVSP